MKNAWKLAAGFVLGLAIIAGLARTLSEDLDDDAPVITPASTEVTRAPPPAPAIAKSEHTPEPRPVATKRRKKPTRPSGATTTPIEASLPDSPSPTPDPTPPRTDLDAPLPH